MRPGVFTVANAVAAVVLSALAVLAVLLTIRLGSIALLLLGTATWFVCTRIALNDAAPTWSADVFKAGMARPPSAEGRAALDTERQQERSTLTPYRRCGILLTLVGAVGFAWELWR